MHDPHINRDIDVDSVLIVDGDPSKLSCKLT